METLFKTTVIVNLKKSRKHLFLLIIQLSLFIFYSHAQDFEMVKNINPNGSGNPERLIKYNGKIYFTADDGINKRQLWVTDGTEAGTQMLKQINPTDNSLLFNFIVFNNLLFFTADDGINGREWWYTDGTETGTQILKDINAGAQSSNPTYAKIFNGKMYFAADDGINGNELWITDGTTIGTQLFKDINPGSGGSGPSNFTIFNNKLVFTAYEPTNGKEIWISDGTNAGTQFVTDIKPGNGDCGCASFTELNNQLLFVANDYTHADALWTTDGTASGTYMVKNISMDPYHYIYNLHKYNNQVYFTAIDSVHGGALWVTDGTTLGTNLFIDFLNAPGYFFNFNNKMFFMYNDDTNGKEIWVSDGTVAGTTILKDINPTGSAFYFPVYDGGTAFFEAYNRFYFVADNGSGDNFELWSSDGTSAGTILHDFPKAPGYLSSPFSVSRSFIAYKDDLYFPADYDTTRNELWRLKLSTTSINTIENNALTTIFPNPTQEYFKINNADEINEVELWDVNGKLLKKWDRKQEEYYLPPLQPAVYFLKLKNKEKTVTKLLRIN